MTRAQRREWLVDRVGAVEAQVTRHRALLWRVAMEGVRTGECEKVVAATRRVRRATEVLYRAIIELGLFDAEERLVALWREHAIWCPAKGAEPGLFNCLCGTRTHNEALKASVDALRQ